MSEVLKTINTRERETSQPRHYSMGAQEWIPWIPYRHPRAICTRRERSGLYCIKRSCKMILYFFLFILFNASFALKLNTRHARSHLFATSLGLTTLNHRRHLHLQHHNPQTDLDNTTKKKKKKFVVVTGGVISGIGKGVTASSIGVVLKMLHRRPTAIKIDPYLNVDAGTMSPFEHGEVFVLDDGGETDLDLGNYERFLDVSLTSDSNLTTGKVYQAVITKERKGDYLGKTVQIIPHITNEIIDRIFHVAREPVDGSGEEPDVVVIELGGTIGDIESMPFVEALRQLQLQVGVENMCFLHVSMVPTVGEDKEQKTKPTQHSVKGKSTTEKYL